jgi:hypothetical protein
MNGCFQANQPSRSNINPFMADFTLSGDPASGQISYTQNYWKNYECRLGTGVETLPNSYYLYGGSISNNAWLPAFATRRPLGSFANDDIAFTAPTWNGNSGGGYLNLKFTRTNATGNIPHCPHAANCNPTYTDIQITKSGYPSGGAYTINYVLATATHSVVVADGSSSIHPLDPLQELDCLLNGVFRTTDEAEHTMAQNRPPANEALTIYPNPAFDEITVSLQPSGEGVSSKIVLMDMQGRQIAQLYEGTKKDIKLKLPPVAPGIYFLKTVQQGGNMNIQKLVITQ